MKNDDAPIRYCNVSYTQLSIARYYGCMTVNGIMYIYDAATDTLTREDVVKSELKSKADIKREAREKQKQDIKDKQFNFF